MALSPSSSSESASPGVPILSCTPPAPLPPADVDAALATAATADVPALQVGAAFTCAASRGVALFHHCLKPCAALCSGLRLLPRQPRRILEAFERHLAQLTRTLAVSPAERHGFMRGPTDSYAPQLHRIVGHPSVRSFADEAALEGGGHMLRLLPLLAPAHVPFGSMPLLHPPRSHSEDTVPVRALTDKLLQRARNK